MRVGEAPSTAGAANAGYIASRNGSAIGGAQAAQHGRVGKVACSMSCVLHSL